MQGAVEGHDGGGEGERAGGQGEQGGGEVDEAYASAGAVELLFDVGVVLLGRSVFDFRRHRRPLVAPASPPHIITLDEAEAQTDCGSWARAGRPRRRCPCFWRVLGLGG